MRKRIFLFPIIILVQIVVSCQGPVQPVQKALLSEPKQPDQYLMASNGRLFVTDAADNADERCTTILVYSLDDYQLLHSIGGTGKEPGKFWCQKGHCVTVSSSNDRVAVSGTYKAGLYTLNAEPIKEIVKPGADHFGIQAFGDGFVGKFAYSENDTNYYQVNLYDSTLTVTHELVRHVNSGTAFYSDFFFQTAGDRVYVVGRTRDFDIDVFNRNGELVKTIHHDYDRIAPTQEEIEALLDIYRTNPAWAPYFEQIKASLIFPESHQAIARIWISEDHLFVVTRRQENDQREIWILDLDGNKVKKTWIPFPMQNAFMWNPYTFDRGKLIQLLPDPDQGGWVLTEYPVL